MLVPKCRKSITERRLYCNLTPSYDLTIAEKAKALMQSRISGGFTSLSWVSLEKSPMFTSIIPYALHDRWYCNPLIVLNKEGQHYKNISLVQKGSFLILPLTPKRLNPSKLPLPRVNLIGSVNSIEKEEDIQIVIDCFEKIVPGSSNIFGWNSGNSKCTIYEFVVDSVHYQFSSGNMETISADEFRTCKEDSIAKSSRPLIEKANEQSYEKLKKLCFKYAEIEVSECYVFGLDEKGMDVMAKDNSNEQWSQLRFPWDVPIRDLNNYTISLDQFLRDKSE